MKKKHQVSRLRTGKFSKRTQIKNPCEVRSWVPVSEPTPECRQDAWQVRNWEVFWVVLLDRKLAAFLDLQALCMACSSSSVMAWSLPLIIPVVRMARLKHWLTISLYSQKPKLRAVQRQAPRQAMASTSCRNQAVRFGQDVFFLN